MAEDQTPTPPSPDSGAGADDVQSLVDEAMNDAQSSLEEIKDEVDDAAVTSDASEPQAPVAVDLAQQLDHEPESDPLLGDADPEAKANDPTLSKIQLLNDVDLDVMIELGRTDMLVEDVLRLGEGSVVELDKLAGDPVDVYVNNRLIARGEVLVLNDNFCIRISEIIEDLEEQAQAALQAQQADA